MTEKNVPTPNFVINDTDKLYLAAALKSVGKLTYVYTLACASVGNRKYEMDPRTEIATFTDASLANVYYRTVKEMMAFQGHSRAVSELRKAMSSYILTFNDRIR